MKHWKDTITNMPGRVIYAAAALASLVFMFCYAEQAGFWYDEFAQICYSGPGQSLLDSLLIPDPTPPLFSVAANLWYDLVPFGERWLLLLPQLAVAGAVYVCGLWGACLGGKTVGLWSALLLGSSQMVIEQCGFEFRSYGFYLFFAALALYLCTRRLRNGGVLSGKEQLCYAAVLLGLHYSHLFGSLLWGILLLTESAAVLRKNGERCRLLPYGLSALGFLPWVVYYFVFAEPQISQAVAEWMTDPGIWDVVKLGTYLCSNNLIRCVLLAAGTAVLLWETRKYLRNGGNRGTALSGLLPMVAAVGIVIPVFLFAVVRSEQASLWVKRYFTGLFPCCAVICAVGCGALVRWVRKRCIWVGAVLCCVLLAGSAAWPLYKTASGDSHLPHYYHREAVQYLASCEDVADGQALVLTTMDRYMEGVEHYYVENLAKRAKFSIESVFWVDSEELLRYNIVYLDYSFWEENGRLADGAAVLREAFVLDQTWDEMCLERYVRKPLP